MTHTSKFTEVTKIKSLLFVIHVAYTYTYRNTVTLVRLAQNHMQSDFVESQRESTCEAEGQTPVTMNADLHCETVQRLQRRSKAELPT